MKRLAEGKRVFVHPRHGAAVQVKDYVVFQDESGDIYLAGYAVFETPEVMASFFELCSEEDSSCSSVVQKLSELWEDESALADYINLELGIPVDETLSLHNGAYYYPVLFLIYSHESPRAVGALLVEEEGRVAFEVRKDVLFNR